MNKNSVWNSLSITEKIHNSKKRCETNQLRQFLFAHGIEFGDVNTKLKYMTLSVVKFQRQAFYDLDTK